MSIRLEVYAVMWGDFEGIYLISLHTTPENALAGAQKHRNRRSRAKLELVGPDQYDEYEIILKHGGHYTNYHIEKQIVD